MEIMLNSSLPPLNKKIALYIPSMNGGGAERVMLTLANGLAEKGIEVDLVLNKAQGPYLKDLSNNVNIIELKASRAIKSIIPLALYIRKHKPDTILSAMNYINIITLVSRTLSRANTKVAISEHDNLSASIKNQNRPLFNFILKKIMSIMYRRADTIIAVSDGVAEDLSQQLNISRETIITIYNPIVTKNLLKEIKHAEDKPHSWFANKTSPVLISVGRLTRQKGLDVLIHSLPKVLNHVDCRLVILGEGSLESDLRKTIKELNLEKNVDLVGFVDNPYSWMLNSDLFILPSRHEGFGNVIVEAMACGTPIISTDCPSGPSEILEDGKWGDLIPVGNVEELSNAIINSLTTPNRISANNLKKRAYEFSAEVSINKYLKALTYI